MFVLFAADAALCAGAAVDNAAESPEGRWTAGSDEAEENKRGSCFTNDKSLLLMALLPGEEVKFVCGYDWSGRENAVICPAFPGDPAALPPF